jgi:hypothetical protein
MSAHTDKSELPRFLQMLQRESLPGPGQRRATRVELAAAQMRPATTSVLSTLLLLALCGAAIAIGWGLVVAGLLYVVASYSTTTWLLTALGLAAAHAALAICCWNYALVLARNLAPPAAPDEPADRAHSSARRERAQTME